MKRLWAPWRLEYIKNAQGGSCFFCRYKRQRNDRRNLVLHRTATCMAVLNLYPYNTGHMMVAPMSHKNSLAKLTRDELIGMMELTRDVQRLMDRTMKPHGYNIGINLGRTAGAGLPGHIHIHIVPRWNGDTNYMPVVGKTKVMPQALSELYDQLRKVWVRLPPGQKKSGK